MSSSWRRRASPSWWWSNSHAPRCRWPPSAMVMANGRIVQTGAARDVESVLHSAYLGSVQPGEATSAHNGTTNRSDTGAGAP